MLILSFVAALLLPAQTPDQALTQTAAQTAVLAPIQAMFAGMTARDASAIRAPFLPGASMVLMREGKPSQLTIESFAGRIAKPAPNRVQPHMEERIRNPLVRIDHDLAVVWAPFTFLIDGKPDHCGTDLFNLVQVDGKWLIASVADTGSATCPTP